MKLARLGASFVIAVATAVMPQTVPSNDKPTESGHRNGPHGLEGWTLNWPDPDNPGVQLPITLVVARDGKILRRIDGEGMVWDWIFWADGKEVAYESGPKHFSLDCVLFDLAKGRAVARVDCFHELPADAPDWAKALEGVGVQ